MKIWIDEIKYQVDYAYDSNGNLKSKTVRAEDSADEINTLMTAKEMKKHVSCSMINMTAINMKN